MNIAAFSLFACVFAGSALLSVSMDRHVRQVFGRTQSRSAALVRTAGWLMLTVGLWPAIQGYGLSIGVSLWFGVLAIAATAVALLLSYRPRLLPACTLAAVFVAATSLLSTM